MAKVCYTWSFYCEAVLPYSPRTSPQTREESGLCTVLCTCSSTSANTCTNCQPTPTPSPSPQCPFECRRSTLLLPQYLSCVMMHVQCLRRLLAIQPTPSPSAIQPTPSPSPSQCPLECRLGPTASEREIIQYLMCLVMHFECLNVSSTPSPSPLFSHPLDCPLADTSLCDPQCPYVNFECPAGLIPSTRTFSQSEICEPLFSAEFNARCSFVFDDQGNIRAYKC